MNESTGHEGLNEPTLRKAMDTLEFLSQDRDSRYLYEMRQKALHDEVSMIEGAREEGIQIGETRGQIAVARKMLSKGKDISEISEFTGLTEEEIQKLREQIH